MSTKLYPGPFDCYAKLADDEPYFILRATDPNAPRVIEYWAARRGATLGGLTDPKIPEALATADAMRAWHDRNMHAQPCGCDRGALYVCEVHR